MRVTLHPQYITFFQAIARDENLFKRKCCYTFLRKTVERVFLIFTSLRVENEVKTSILIRVDVKRYLVAAVFFKQLFEKGSLPER